MKPTARPTRFTSRNKLVRQMRERLQAQSWPRLQMSLIVAFTGLAGLLASAVLLKLGLQSMALRYTVSTLLAYGAFLGLLWLWMRTRPDDWADVADGVSSGVDVVDLASAALRSRGVGMQSVQAPHMDVAELPTTSDSSGGWNLGDVADADEFAVVVLIVVAVVALASAGMYIIVQAPSLLAEVALDGAVMGSLYQRLQQAERQHWALSAWAYTRWPLLGLLCVMALLGWGLQLAAPGALTMGQALAALNS